MYSERLQSTRTAMSWLALVAACTALLATPLAAAQAPAASGNSAQTPSPEDLERLVGPIALYPDDLVAIILPASTNPLQIVQADRFLDKRKQDPRLPVDDKWDDSVKALVNYPDVVKQMSADLDWTADLGEAVVADQGAVLDAVQAFRRKAEAAGNLKTDAKQVVEVDKDVIQIVPANPEVIYVPQYDPATVIVYSPYPVYGYYPIAVPGLLLPIPTRRGIRRRLDLGCGDRCRLAWRRLGLQLARWHHQQQHQYQPQHQCQQYQSWGGANQLPAGGSAWKPNKQPGQVARSAGRPTSYQRVGDARPSGGAGGLGRPSTQPAGGGFNQGGAAGDRSLGAGAGGANRDAFGGYASGRQTSLDSSRGAASRSSMQSGGGRSSFGGGGGGGARAGGGGGGRGGGGRR